MHSLIDEICLKLWLPYSYKLLTVDIQHDTHHSQMPLDISKIFPSLAVLKQPYYHIPLTFKFTFSSFPYWLYNHYLSSPKHQKCLWYQLFFLHSIMQSFTKFFDLCILHISQTHIFSFIYTPVLEKEMASHSSIHAWKIPWTEEPGGLQSMGLQSRTRLSDFTSLHSIPSDYNLFSGLSHCSYLFLLNAFCSLPLYFLHCYANNFFLSKFDYVIPSQQDDTK